MDLQLLGMFATTAVVSGGACFALARFIASTHVAAADKLRTISDRNAQEAIDENKTIKASLKNRDIQILELERQLLKSDMDLKSSLPADRVRLLEELQSRVVRFDQLREALLGSEDEVWKLRGTTIDAVLAEALRKSRVKVITVANLKGGVGKTTITINLAAHYALTMGFRVLVIDFDYQGSLTATALNATKAVLGANINADAALGGDVNGRWMTEVPRDLSKVLPNTRLITCGATFDRFENQTMMRWLIGDMEDDVRYRLARLIVTPEVQAAYDLILIDAPPRTSLGAINALCASHALLIPTVPDSLSVDAVGRFLARMTKLRSMAPALTDALVIPSLTEESQLRPAEVEALREAKSYLSNWSGGAFVTETFIRHFTTLAKSAGREIAYVTDKQHVRPAFDKLGTEVSSRLGIKKKDAVA